MILFCGDPHGNFDHIAWAVCAFQPKAIVLLGDIEAQRPLHFTLDCILRQTDVWWIPGNHDTDNEENYDNLFGSELSDRNLHGRVIEIDGVRIAGLGGVFRGQVWRHRVKPRSSPMKILLPVVGKETFGVAGCR